MPRLRERKIPPRSGTYFSPKRYSATLETTTDDIGDLVGFFIPDFINVLFLGSVHHSHPPVLEISERGIDELIRIERF